MRSFVPWTCDYELMDRSYWARLLQGKVESVALWSNYIGPRQGQGPVVPCIPVPFPEPFPATASLSVNELLVPNEVKSTHLMFSEIDYPATEVCICLSYSPSELHCHRLDDHICLLHYMGWGQNGNILLKRQSSTIHGSHLSELECRTCLYNWDALCVLWHMKVILMDASPKPSA